MPDTPRIILHNSDTVHLAQLLQARYPHADFRECDSYDALPIQIESYRPEVVYSCDLQALRAFHATHFLAPMAHAGLPMAERELTITGNGIRQKRR